MSRLLLLSLLALSPGTVSAAAGPLGGDLDSEWIPIAGSPARGPALAPATVVVFGDFQCPYCARLSRTLVALRERYGDQLRWVFKHRPLAFHREAALAAEAAWAAGVQGRFWAMHDALMGRGDLRRPALEQAAFEVGLDLARFGEALDRGAGRPAVEADGALALRLGVVATPTSFVNGVRVPGALPFDAFCRVIDAELIAAATLREAGVPAGMIYRARVAEIFRPPEPAPILEAIDTGGPIYRIPVGSSPQLGPPDALVTVVVFGDLGCAFCARAQPTLARLLRAFEGRLRLVFKHSPSRAHPGAALAAEAAMAAGEQGRFWALYDRVLAGGGSLSAGDLLAHAEALELDVPLIAKALETRRFRNAVAADQDLARRLGAQQTPTFFVNGRRLVGAVPYRRFAALVSRALERARAAVQAGTPPAAVYERLTEGGLRRAPVHEPIDPGAPETRLLGHWVSEGLRGRLEVPIPLRSMAEALELVITDRTLEVRAAGQLGESWVRDYAVQARQGDRLTLRAVSNDGSVEVIELELAGETLRLIGPRVDIVMRRREGAGR